jgi:hypothetical protein
VSDLVPTFGFCLSEAKPPADMADEMQIETREYRRLTWTIYVIWSIIRMNMQEAPENQAFSFLLHVLA